MKNSMILKTYSRRWIPFRKRWIRRTWRSFADEITRLVFIDVWKMFKNNICSLGSSGHGWLDKVHCQWIWVPILVFGSFRFHMLYKLTNTLAGNIGLFLACKYIVWKKMVILVIIVILMLKSKYAIAIVLEIPNKRTRSSWPQDGASWQISGIYMK